MKKNFALLGLIELKIYLTIFFTAGGSRGIPQMLAAEQMYLERQRQASTESKDDFLNSSRRKRKYPTSRPFKCDQCDHSFNQRIHLKKHLSKHTGMLMFNTFLRISGNIHV